MTRIGMLIKNDLGFAINTLCFIRNRQVQGWLDGVFTEYTVCDCINIRTGHCFATIHGEKTTKEYIRILDIMDKSLLKLVT